MRFEIPAALRGLWGSTGHPVPPGSATMGSHSREPNTPHTPVLDNIINLVDYNNMAFPPYPPSVRTDAAPTVPSNVYSGSAPPSIALCCSADERSSASRRNSAYRRGGAGVGDTSVAPGYGQGHNHGLRINHVRGRHSPYMHTANPRCGNSSKGMRAHVRVQQPALGYRNDALDIDLAPSNSVEPGVLFPERSIYEVFPAQDTTPPHYSGTQSVEEGMDNLSISSRGSAPGARTHGSRKEFDTLGRPYGFNPSPPSSPLPQPSLPPSQEDDDVWGPYIPRPLTYAVAKKSRTYKGYYLELPDLDPDSGSDSDSVDSFDDLDDDYGGGRVGRRHGYDNMKHGLRMCSPARSRKTTQSVPTAVRIVESDTFGYCADNSDHAREALSWRHGRC